MKNLFKFLMAVAVLFTASCAKEDISSSIAGEETVEVFFSTNLADLGTRAYDNGSNVNVLRYIVCDQNDNVINQLCGTCDERGTDGKFRFSLKLIKSMTYNISFWAQNSAAAYIIENNVVSINYANNKGNLDAFYCKKTITPEMQGQTLNIQLRRPFAQLNALTSDGAEILKNDVAGYANIKSTVAVKGVYSKFDLISGQAQEFDKTQFVTFGDPEVIPAAANEVLKADYTYLSMCYLFASENYVADVKFTFTATRTNGSTITVPTPEYTSVPLKPNFRTNILGALLTNPTAFNVEVVKDYDGTKEEKIVNASTAVDIQEAITAASEEAGKSTKIILQDNINLGDLVAGLSSTRDANNTGLVIPANKVITLDLNGKTLTYTGNDVLFRVNGATLTINGEKAGSAIVTNPTNPGTGGNGYVALVKDNGTLNINGGSYNAKAACTIAQVSAGTLNVYAGYFQVNLDNYIDANGNAIYLLNCLDDPYKNGTAKINVYGGSFYKFNPANNAAEGAGTNFCAKDYIAVKENDYWTVTDDYKDYERNKNFFYGGYISVSTGSDFLPIVAVMPEITKFSVFDGDIRITDKVVFRFFKVKKEDIDENSYKVSFNLAILDDKGNDLELKPGMPSTINGKEYLNVYVNLIELPAGYDVTEVKVNGSALTPTTNASGNPATGEYWLGSDHKDVYLQTMTAGKMEFIVSKTAN